MNAGEYQLIISLADKTQYQWAGGGTDDVTFTLKINQKALTVISPAAGVYDGNPKAPDVTFSGLAGSEMLVLGTDYTLTYSIKSGDNASLGGESGNLPLGVGVYTVTASFIESSVLAPNYVWALGGDSCEYKIVGGGLAQPSASNLDVTYNGEFYVITVTGFVTTTMSFKVQTKSPDGDAFADCLNPRDFFKDDNQTFTAKNAGTYLLIISIIDKEQYTWLDGTNADLEITLKINKKTLTVVPPAAGIYDGDPKTPDVTFSGLVPNEELTLAGGDYSLKYEVNGTGELAGDLPKGVGFYTITVTLLNTETANNYVLENVTCSYQINAFGLTRPTGNSREVTYNGEQQGIQIINFDGSTMTAKWDQGAHFDENSGNFTATDAGTYTLTISITKPDQYNWRGGGTESITFTLTIHKKVLTILAPSDDAYTGSKFDKIDVDFSGLVANQSLKLGVDYTLEFIPASEGMCEDGFPKELGKYTIKVKLSESLDSAAKNYKLEVDTCKYEIYDGGLRKPTASNREVTYSGQEYSIEVTNYNESTMTFTVEKDGVSVGNPEDFFNPDTRQFKATNAGVYVLVISIADSHYRWDDETKDSVKFTLTIYKKALTVLSPTAGVYTGEKLYPQVSFAGLVGDESIEGEYDLKFVVNGNGLVTDGQPVNVGNYIITVSFKEDAVVAKNYTFEGGSATCDYEVYSGGLRKPTANSREVTYSAEEYVIKVDGFDHETMNATVTKGSGIATFEGGEFKAMNAGEYELTISIKNPTQYQWVGGGTEDIVITLKINKKVLTVTSSPTAAAYDGSPKTPKMIFSGLIGMSSEDLVENSHYKVTFAQKNGGSELLQGGLPKGVGTYTITVELINTITANYTFEGNQNTCELEYEIYGGGLRRPVGSDREVTYSGEDYVIEITGYDDDAMSYSVDGGTAYFDGNKLTLTAKNAGTYTLTISIKEEQYTSWADGGSGDITFTLTIQKKVITIIAPTAGVYDGKEKTPDVKFSGLVPGEELKFNKEAPETGDYKLAYAKTTGTLGSNNLPQGKGLYTITVTLLETDTANNYKLEADTCEYEIYEGGLRKPTANDLEVTYDGKEYTIEVKDFNADEMEYSLGGNSGAEVDNAEKFIFKATNAGTYTLTISIRDKQYKWADGSEGDITFTLKINKKVLTIIPPSADPYTGKANSKLDVTFSGLVSGEKLVKGEDYLLKFVAKENGSLDDADRPVGVGTYTITVRLLNEGPAANYTFEEGKDNCEYVIYEGGLRRPIANDLTVIYNGEEYTITVTGYKSDLMNFELAMMIDGEEKPVSNGEAKFLFTDALGTFTALNAGVYKLKISIKNTDEYKWEDGQTDVIVFTLTINKKAIRIIAPNAGIYDGNPKTPDVDFSGLVGSQKLGAGDYTLEYLAGTGQLGGDGGNLPLGVGTYTIQVTLSTSADSIAKNYELEVDTCEYVIREGGLAKPTANNLEVIYKGEDYEMTISGFDPDKMGYELGGDSGAAFSDVSFKFTAKNAGSYTLTITIKDSRYKWEDGTNDPITFTLTIHKKVLTVLAPPADAYDNGNEFEPNVRFSGYVDAEPLEKGEGKDYKLEYAVKESKGLLGGTGKPAGVGYYVITVTLLGTEKAANYTFENDSDTETCDYEIYEGGLRKPTANNLEVTYDGKEHVITVSDYNGNSMSFELDGDSGATFDGVDTFKALNAGVYTLTISIADNQYTWEDGTKDPITFTLTIHKKVLVILAPTADAYNGETKTPDVDFYGLVSGEKLKDGDTKYYTLTYAERDPGSNILDGLLPKGVGYYIITVKLTEGTVADNYTFETGEEGTCEYEIYAGGLRKPTANDLEVTYNGKEYVVEVKDYNGTTMQFKLTVGENDDPVLNGEATFDGKYFKATNAGVYKLTIEIQNTNEYMWADKETAPISFTLTIHKKVIRIIAPSSASYNGETKTPDVDFSGLVEGEKLKEADGTRHYTLSYSEKTPDSNILDGGYPKGVGYYVITVTLMDDAVAGNYTFETGEEGTCEYEIYEGGLRKPTANDREVTYNGTEYVIEVTDFDPETMEYALTKNGDPVSGDAATFDSNKFFTAKNAGTYQLTISIKNPSQYQWADKSTAAITFTLKINKKTLTLLSPAADAYDGTGEGFDPKVNFYGLVGEDEFEKGTHYKIDSITINESGSFKGGKPFGVGSYTITVSLIEGTLADNYELDKSTCGYDIYAGGLRRPTANDREVTYSGEEWEVIVSGFN